MTKKLFGFLSKEPLIYLHYLLLLGVLFIGFYAGSWIFKEYFLNIWVMLGWFYVVLSLGDMLIHQILGVD